MQGNDALREALEQVTIAVRTGCDSFVPHIIAGHLRRYPSQMHEWALDARYRVEMHFAEPTRARLDDECLDVCRAIERANEEGRWMEATRIGAAWRDRAAAAGYMPPLELAARLSEAALDDPVTRTARANRPARRKACA